MSEPLLELKDIQLRNDRGGHVFTNLNLSLQPGQSAIISGGAGSGKTLLVQLLLGLRRPDAGEISLFGQQLRSSSGRAVRKIRKQIGGVGGTFELVPSITVSENITLPLVIGGERKKVRKERLLRSLSEFSLLKLAGKYPNSLTRVENTLTQFARATIANQPLIIIDEPLAGLDHGTAARVFESLVRVALSGRSMLILASDLPRAEIPNSVSFTLSGGVLV